MSKFKFYTRALERKMVKRNISTELKNTNTKVDDLTFREQNIPSADELFADLGRQTAGEVVFPTDDSTSDVPTDTGFSGVGISKTGWTFSSVIYQVVAVALGVLGVGFNTVGQLIAGAGALILDVKGLSIVEDVAYGITRAIKWMVGSTEYSRIYGYHTADDHRMQIEANDITDLDSLIGIYAKAPAGRYAQVSMSTEEGANAASVTVHDNQVDVTGDLYLSANTYAGGDVSATGDVYANSLRTWTVKYKTADESVNNSTVLQNDDELIVGMVANGIYSVRGRLWFNTLAAADFKYRISFGGTTLYIKHTSYPAGSAVGTTYIDTSSPSTVVNVTGTGTVGGFVEFDALCVVDGSPRNFVLAWAQNTATVGNTTLLAGSYIEYVKVA